IVEVAFFVGHGDQSPVTVSGGNFDSVDRSSLSIGLTRCGDHVGGHAGQRYKCNQREYNSSHGYGHRGGAKKAAAFLVELVHGLIHWEVSISGRCLAVQPNMKAKASTPKLPIMKIRTIAISREGDLPRTQLMATPAILRIQRGHQRNAPDDDPGHDSNTLKYFCNLVAGARNHLNLLFNAPRLGAA